MSRDRLALLAHRALAWAVPVVLGLALAFQWAVNPWPVALIATGTAALGLQAALIVDDYRFLQRRRAWAELLTEYRQAAVDAGHDATRAHLFAELLRAAVLDLHRFDNPDLLDIEDMPTENYDALAGADDLPEDHECLTEPVYVTGVGWMKCEPELVVHVVRACIHCGGVWPCETARAITPRTCKHCGCTDLLACDGGCTWVSEDECSACVPFPFSTSAFTSAMDAVTTTAAEAAAALTEISEGMAADSQGGAA